jgi:two-component system, NtrC family, sensor histidine kinase PilS
VATTSYLVFFTGGAESQFVPLYLLSPLLGGVFLSIRGGVLLAGLSSLAYAGFYLAGRQGMMPTAPYGLTLGLSDGALLLRMLLYLPLLFVVGVIGGYLGRRLNEGNRALEDARAELNRALFDTESILENLSSGLVTVDADGIVRHWNRAASEISGCRPEAIRGRSYAEAFGPSLKEFTERVREALERGVQVSRAEMTIEKPDGTRTPLGLSTSLLRGPDGQRRGVIGLFQDLSEVRALEDRIRRRETLAAIGELSAGIAHEIRNCLNPISGSVEVLQRELKLEGENAVLMDLIATESNRLNRFVTDLLSYSRERDLTLEPVEINSYMAETCDTLGLDPRCSAGIRVRFEPAEAETYLNVDREQMRQVWINLAVNAMEAMTSGGDLVVRWRGAGTGRIVVEFEDQGSGIAAEDMPRVGQPFYTTKESGTGLGLPIAHRIVERHGGKLTLHSPQRRGTIVRVDLPEGAAIAAHAA